MFTADHRAKAKEKNPELTFGELGKFLGEMWGKLPELQKEAYKTRASKAMDKYKVNFYPLWFCQLAVEYRSNYEFSRSTGKHGRRNTPRHPSNSMTRRSARDKKRPRRRRRR
tara:strand:- start:401 stop:736 length:336 start_codon:yes stop_codon:yes gene_type:complete